MDELDTTRLAALIGQRHKLLSQFLALGQKQAELIAADQLGATLRLLGAKNQLIAALQQVERGLAPFQDQDPESRRWDSPEARQACATQAAECKQMLDEVMRLEQQNEISITARRDQAAERLESNASSGQARDAYRANAAPPRVPAPHAPLTQADTPGTNAQAGPSGLS